MSTLVCSPAEQIRLRTTALVTDLRARRAHHLRPSPPTPFRHPDKLLKTSIVYPECAVMCTAISRSAPYNIRETIGTRDPTTFDRTVRSENIQKFYL